MSTTRAGLPDGAGAQLDVLADLETRLGSAGIDVWLRGGWAIDFLVGVVTRAHADIDVIVEANHRERLGRLLPEPRYRVVTDGDAQRDYSTFEVELSVVFIERNTDGAVGVPGIPQWRWLTGALDEPTRTLEGVTCRPLSARQLLDEKQHYAHDTGRPLRPQDIQSIEMLQQILSRGSE